MSGEKGNGIMKYFLVVFAVAYFFIGFSFVVYTEKTRDKALWLFETMPSQLLGLIAFGIGALFWVSAPAVKFPFVIKILAVTACAKGLVVGALPGSLLIKIYDRLFALPQEIYMLCGLAAVIISLLIFLVL